MNSPVIDKVARRRSTIAILISLVALLISVDGLDAVRTNFKGFMASIIATAPFMLVCVAAIYVLLQTPKFLQRMKNHRNKGQSSDSSDSTDPQKKCGTRED